MYRPTGIRIPFAAFLLLCMIVLLPSCSDDPGTPQPALEEDPPWDPDLPILPTVDNSQDPLPDRSDFLSAESALLQNFSPLLSGATPYLLGILNEATVLDFRLPASRNTLFLEGTPCFPEHLEWSPDTVWNTLERTTTEAPFVLLGSFGGSNYYLCQTATRWMFADLNCRNYGGHLVSLTSVEEQDAVFSWVQSLDESLTFFIGLTDWDVANQWVWTSGEDYEWSHWSSGEPNNAGTLGEQFTMVYNTGLWNDVTVNNSYAYVMERNNPLPLVLDDEISCAIAGADHLYLNELAAPGKIPHVERRIYWQKVFQTTLSPGETHDENHSYNVGTDEASGQAFAWAIGVPDTTNWVSAAVEIETELGHGFNREVLIRTEEPLSNNYSATAPANKTLLVALWQLRERYFLVDSQGDQWSDPKYYVNGFLPYLDQGLAQDYLQTIEFD